MIAKRMIKFTPKNTYKKARTGSLEISGREFPTPFPILFTDRGQVPYLTPDLVDQLPSGLINYSFDHILKDYDTVPSQYGYKEKISFTSFNNSHDNLSPFSVRHLASDNYIGIPTDQGLKKYTVDEFANVAEKSGLMWFTPPCDTPSLDLLGPKRMGKSFARTLKYLDAVLETKTEGQFVAGVVVGGNNIEARLSFTKELLERDIFGIVFEGLGLGESLDERSLLFKSVIDNISDYQPRMFLHCNNLVNVFNAIENGIDIVDSVYPIQLAEKGYAFNITTKLLIWDSAYERDASPIDKECNCYACKNHSKAYIHHLLQTHELLGPILLVHHNLHAYFRMFQWIRNSIDNGTFEELKNEMFNKDIM